MAYLADAAETRKIINRYHIVARRKFGQNFLIDPDVIEEILSAADLGPGDRVLEIGPGIGTLTQYLAERAGRVDAVEIDRSLEPVLADTLSSYSNVEIHFEDVMKADLNQIVGQASNSGALKVVANLPYYITTPVLMLLLEKYRALSSITVMVQKEVAERMQAEAGTKEYGALSLAVQYFAAPEIVCQVGPESFIPSPAVGSSVVRLTRYVDPPVKVQDEDLFFRLVRASFNQRRKTLVNGLSGASFLSFSKEEIGEALGQIGKDRNIRGEVLTLAEFARLSDLLSGFNKGKSFG